MLLGRQRIAGYKTSANRVIEIKLLSYTSFLHVVPPSSLLYLACNRLKGHIYLYTKFYQNWMSSLEDNVLHTHYIGRIPKIKIILIYFTWALKTSRNKKSTLFGLVVSYGEEPVRNSMLQQAIQITK